MNLDSLPKVKTRNPKRVGRGQGSGRGKTSGRGTKGQKARSKMPITHPHFEGGQRPLFKRLPYRRGKGNSKISKKPLVINLDAINLLPKGKTINIENLINYKIIDAQDAARFGVKILGNGKLTNPYTFEMKTSNKAAQKIEKAGGKILKSSKEPKVPKNTKKIKEDNN